MAKSSVSLLLMCYIILISSFNFGGITAEEVIYNGQKVWCVAKPSASETELNNNIGYVCTQMGMDCSRIQPGGQCFYPDTPINHASVVMNMYFQNTGRASHNCDFSASSLVSITDPSYGGCLYTYA